MMDASAFAISVLLINTYYLEATAKIERIGKIERGLYN
jgi:hypothetical protein